MEVVTAYAWIGALLFARLGAVLMLAPGWGEASVPTTFRLSAALLATAALAPSMADKVPPAPPMFGETLVLIISEVFIGLFMGSGARLFMSALQVAGQVMGMQTGLGFAQQMDPTVGQSGAVIGVFLSLMALVLLMTMGIHRMMLQAAADSYELFPIGSPPPIGEAAEWALVSVSSAFRMGLQMAAPILVFALTFNLAIGLVSRLIPQVQIFFIAMPSQIMLGLSMMAFVLGGGLLTWMAALERFARFQPPV